MVVHTLSEFHCEWHKAPQHSNILPVTSILLNSRWGNSTTTAQTPNINPPQWIIQVQSHTIRHGTATMQVSWRTECSTTLGQWNSECFTASTCNYWDCKTVHGCYCIHKASLGNTIWYPVLDGWIFLEMYHWGSESSLGNSSYFCRYSMGVSTAQWSIPQKRSANLTSHESWILFNASLSDSRYWQHCTTYLPNTPRKYHLSTFGK
jgi:hypothetical protein